MASERIRNRGVVGSNPTSGSPRGWATVDKKVLADIRNNPELYYLDAHNGEFPNGAIRRQLA